MINRRTFAAIAALGAIPSRVKAQQRGTYQVERKSTSDTAEAVTVQVPTGSARNARMIGASIYCSVEAEVTVERDGTAATGTGLTILKTNAASPSSALEAFHSSDVGTANRTTSRQTVGAGGTMVLDLSAHELYAGQNITIRTAHASGTVIINVQWVEY